MPRAEREQRLLDAGERAFAAAGYHAASVEEIAAAAGVTAPMIYAYFGSKEGLLVAGMQRAYERCVERVVEAAEADGPAEERTRLVSSAVLGWVEEYLDVWPLIYGAQALGGKVASKAAEARGGMVDVIAQFIADLLGEDADVADLEPIAEVAVGVHLALAERWARHREEPRERQEALAMWFIWSVLGPLVEGRPVSG